MIAGVMLDDGKGYGPAFAAVSTFHVAAFFGQQSWSILVTVLPRDLFPRRVVASVAGLVALAGRWEVSCSGSRAARRSG